MLNYSARTGWRTASESASIVFVNSKVQFATQDGSATATSARHPDLDPEAAWQQVLSRDQGAAFLYAVATTGVFCRPSCTSRRPLKKNVRFFRSAEEAQAAGFRPCKRCEPTTAQEACSAKTHADVDRVRWYIEAHVDRPVRLAELGSAAGLSPFTVQRLFKQAMGVSPLQYQRALRAGNDVGDGRNDRLLVYSHSPQRRARQCNDS